ncbi:alpha/beta hydrolase [Hoyosella sp. G463]|uniref:Alpha/beta hydrolase n=1 Tax=Lolliginicoccus lacisalsi TaxID=2742202 RepID=A0A927PLK1_9ACTN|nr:alpha/beta hydrolase [Lolliginicoccus lacisalsi]MBD8505476.1 alpha/beta hydrolase [Lolliginicoccus lacisalsi]
MEIVSKTMGENDYTARCGGDQRNAAVLILVPEGDAAEDYDELCARLHNSGLRTATVPVATTTPDADILGLIDALGLGWVHVTGIRAATVVAWQFAAHHFDRTSSLIVLGSGHPAAVTSQDTAIDATCPAIEVGTTIIATSPRELAHAKASGQHIRGDLRIVTTTDTAGAASELGVLATEVVLRSNPW